MTVYFVAQTAAPNLVKIGKTDNLDERLTAVAASFDGGVDLLATCAGGEQVERFLHMLFLAEHVEGEWFERTPELDFIISRFPAREARHYGPRVQRQVGDAADEDVMIAVGLLRELLPKLARFNEGIARAQERAFQLLSAANPLWTRRRVRALWEARATKIAHYEIRNLESALALAANTVGPQMDAYRGPESGLGGSNRPRTDHQP